MTRSCLRSRGTPESCSTPFLNLCVNAKDAMPDGGTLRVRTERKAYLGGKEFVVVTIGDTGSGIDEHLKSRVFEPYFTTKTESKKIGMGLHLVQKVIKSHKGFIELESDKDKGTSFALYFPVAEPCKEEPKKPRVEPSKEIKKRSVLVVDDEEVVRGLLTRLLRAEGFEVFQAADGIEAMEVLRARPSVDRPRYPRHDHAGHGRGRGPEETPGSLSK